MLLMNHYLFMLRSHAGQLICNYFLLDVLIYFLYFHKMYPTVNFDEEKPLIINTFTYTVYARSVLGSQWTAPTVQLEISSNAGISLSIVTSIGDRPQ